MFVSFFFFKQKTAYEMRISDWSSDVCSSDLYGLPTTVTNCSNNYGPRQHSEKLIPMIIRHCFEWKPIPMYGNGSNIRDWLYVDDHCSAIDVVLRLGRIGQTYNVGGARSEEHTSELQSLMRISYAVFCLKKTKTKL